MAISSFATPTTGFTPLYVKFTGGTLQGASIDVPVGFYEFSWFPNDISAATTFGTIRLTDSAGTSTSYTTVDTNSADARNRSAIYVNVTVPLVFIEAQAQTGNLVIARMSDTPKTLLTGTATTYTTSQSITFTASSTPCILEGAGGGGSGGSSVALGGNGGGSGYFQFFNAPAGTYSLVVGAGGSPGVGNNHDGAAGGASTFAGYTANGGNGGRGAGYGGSNAAGGAVGGGSGGSGATPTGFPYWKTPGSGGTGQGAYGGGGGGGGIGNGGNGLGSNTTGTPGVAGGGGGSGAGGSSSNFSGAAGGNGALAALIWS